MKNFFLVVNKKLNFFFFFFTRSKRKRSKTELDASKEDMTNMGFSVSPSPTSTNTDIYDPALSPGSDDEEEGAINSFDDISLSDPDLQFSTDQELTIEKVDGSDVDIESSKRNKSSKNSSKKSSNKSSTKSPKNKRKKNTQKHVYVLNDEERTQVDEITSDCLTLDLAWEILCGRPDEDVLPGTGDFVDLVETFLTTEWFIICINATNAHAELKRDSAWVPLPANEKGIARLKGFLVMVFVSQERNMTFSNIWSGQEYVGAPQISRIMTRRDFMLLYKHFRIVDPRNLPKKRQRGWHPWQNIKEGVDYLKVRARLMWLAGRRLCIDESSALITSKRMPMKRRNGQKPMKIAVDIYTICDRGQYTCGYPLDDLMYAGKKHTYKPYKKNTLQQFGCFGIVARKLMEDNDVVQRGDLVVMDSKFANTELLEHCASSGVGVVGTFDLKHGDKPQIVTSSWRKEQRRK